MTDTRAALKESLMGLSKDKTPKETVIEQTENPIEDTVVEKEFESAKEEVEKPKVKQKKRRGRPAKNHSITKIHLILERRGLTRKDFHGLIEAKYPDEPISPDALSRIVSGSRKYYSTTTLFRICGALGVTPNQVLEYESEI